MHLLPPHQLGLPSSSCLCSAPVLKRLLRLHAIFSRKLELSLPVPLRRWWSFPACSCKLLAVSLAPLMTAMLMAAMAAASIFAVAGRVGLIAGGSAPCFSSPKLKQLSAPKHAKPSKAVTRQQRQVTLLLLPALAP